MIKYHTESIFTGSLILAIGLTFGGFQNTDVSSANADYNETLRLKAYAQAVEIKKAKALEEVVYKQSDRLSPKELKSVLYEAGFRGERLREAWAVAMKESTGRPAAHNKNSDTGDNSYGLFQINMIGDLGPARLSKYNLQENKDLFDPLVNAKIAFQMSNGGKNWSAWNGIGDSTTKWFAKFPG